jgi:membrane-associated phospholipid phosphatase
VQPSTVRRIPPATLLGATAVCVVLSALVWHTRGAASWELPLIAALRHARLPMSEPILLMWQPVPFAIATTALGWIALQSHRSHLAISGVVGCAAASVVTERVLKPLIGRHVAHSGAAIFPSGHVTAAAAWAMFAWLVIGERSRLRSALLLIPMAVAWIVVSEGLHLPADAIAGLLVGGLVVYGVVFGVDVILRQWSSPTIHFNESTSTTRTPSTRTFAPSGRT